MMKTVMIPFIKLGDRTLAIKTKSLEQGTVSSDEVWIACDDCGENLVDGPCRNGAAECYGCGKKYPLIFNPVQVEGIGYEDVRDDVDGRYLGVRPIA